MYKDEQLREAQGWIAPAQEMDALQITPCRLNCENVPNSITSSGLVAKDSLRRWMERLHVHTVQQLKLDLANVKEGGGLKTKSNGASHSQTFQNRGQVTPLHSFVMHQQEILKPQGTSPPHVAQSAKGAVPASSQLPMQNHVHPSQDVHGLVRSDATSEYQVHAKGQSLVQGYQTSHGAQFRSTTPSSSVNEQVVESGNGSNTSENNFQDISSQFRDALRLDSNALTQKPEVCTLCLKSFRCLWLLRKHYESVLDVIDFPQEANGQVNKMVAFGLHRRTIPAGGRIRISSTVRFVTTIDAYYSLSTYRYTDTECCTEGHVRDFHAPLSQMVRVSSVMKYYYNT
ncbi:hypothetical protein YC2023_015414 [Brassica napus]